MLVIISDIHLTDGTTGKTVAADAFEIFVEHLREVALAASWQNGVVQAHRNHRPGSLGDIFDLIRSTRWSNEAPGDPHFSRPWDDPQTNPNLARKVDEIVEAILAKNADTFKILRDLGQKNLIRIPSATAKGMPAPPNVRRQPVRTRIHYAIGNHDWFLHLPQEPFEQIRRKITQALGLANAPGPYPYEPDDSDALAAVLADHGVFARHGDKYDSFNYDKSKGRNAATLGDAIVVDLINRFPHAVRQQMGDELPAVFLDGLNELANVRPSLLVPVWINGLVNRANLTKTQGNEVKRIWNEIAEELLHLPFVRAQDTISPFDVVDLLETTLRFSKALSFHSIAELVSWIKEKIWGGDSSFAKHALEEEAYKAREARFFVYGHTHHYEVVPLNVTSKESAVFEQIYFNSGTWHPVHEAALGSHMQQSFMQYKVMTHLSFFKQNERKGRRYETWTGSLDD